MMRKTTKVWLLIAAVLVLAGGMLFACVMSELNWDFTRLSTVKYETKTYEISEVFDSITMDTSTADVVFALSDDGKCKIVCHEEEKAKHSVTVEDGVLTVEVVDHRTFLDHIGINFGSPRITVYLPKTEYETLLIHGATGDVKLSEGFTFRDISVSLSTGDICVEGVSAGELVLSVTTGQVDVSGVSCQGDICVEVSTGKVHLADILCKNVITGTDTGDISLVDVIAAEKLSISTATGDVRFDSSDAAEVFVRTDTGDVTGTLLTDKVFLAETDTGSVDVPKTATGGRCQIVTDTGDIKITVE